MNSSQKFIARNRAPRVQIEYDVELYGAEKKVQLPFVMGVFADLAGKTQQPPVADRKFLEIDVDTFDDRMKAMAPTAQFSVPNTLTGEGNLAVDLTFEKMSDFSPAAVAQRVDVLRPLLAARKELENLLAYMDGKSGAEALIEAVLSDRSLLGAIAGGADESADMDKALDALRAKGAIAEPEPTSKADDVLAGLAAQPVAPVQTGPSTSDILGAIDTTLPPEPEPDRTADVLGGLADAAPPPEPEPDRTADVLGGLADTAPLPEPEPDRTADVLGGLVDTALPPEPEPDRTADVLGGLADSALPLEPEPDPTADVLGGLADTAPPPEPEPDRTADVLGGLADTAPPPEPEPDRTADVLGGLADTAPLPEPEPDRTADVLGGLVDTAPPPEPEPDRTADVLGGLADTAPLPEPEPDRTADVLGGLADTAPPPEPEPDRTADVLGGLADAAPPPEPEPDRTTDVLGGLADTSPPPEPEPDRTTDVLGGLADSAPPPEPEADRTTDVLGGLADSAPPPEPEPDRTTDVLGGLADAAPPPEPEPDRTADVLGGLADSALPLEPEPDPTADVLGGLADTAPPPEPEPDRTADVLGGLADSAPPPEPEPDRTTDVLGGLADAAPPPEPEPDRTTDVLGGLADAAPPLEPEPDRTADVLGGLADAAPPPEPEPDRTADVLGGLADTAPLPDGELETEDLDALLADLGPSDPMDVAVTDAEAAKAHASFASGDDPSAGASAARVISADAQPDGTPGVTASATPAASDEPLPDVVLSEPVERDSSDMDPSGVDSGELDATQDAMVTGAETSEVSASPVAEADPSPASDDDLDALLGDLGLDDAPEDAADSVEDDTPVDAASDLDDLDDLLGDLGGEPADVPSADAAEPLASTDPELDDLLEGLDMEGDGDMTDEIGVQDAVPDEPETAAAQTAPDFGTEARAEAGAGAGAASDTSDLDDLLADLGGADEAEPLPEPAPVEPAAPETDPETSDLDDLLAELSSLDGAGEADAEPAAASAVSELDDLLAEFAEPEAAPEEAAPSTVSGPEMDSASDPDNLLVQPVLETPAGDAAAPEVGADLDVATADENAAATRPDGAAGPMIDAAPDATNAASDLDDLLADLGGEAQAPAANPEPPQQAPFGTVSAPRPERGALNRKTFRIAVLGDFTGRAARGAIETGEALAQRPAIPLDVDDIEETIEGFATTLTLPIGKDGAGISVKLGELDDLEPDELFDNVEIFEELSGLRQQLGMGSMATRAIERLKAWGAEYGKPVRVPKRSASTSIPADRKLSDFQALIGDTSGRLTQASPIEDMIAQIVGPYAVKAPDDGVAAMTAAVDEALSGAMRLVLHHPDFQAVEAQWRTLDLLARRIETDAELEIVLYDVSAAELAIDLAAHEDLSQSGFHGLLTREIDPEEGRGGFSGLFGLYTFEETPPHAELLGRIAQLAAHVDAPFVTAMSPAYLEVEKKDRHPLVAKAWDALREMPEAAYLGLASPRFMLRLPYGKKTEPISSFDFEEFTPSEGLSGMLWANPAALVAILLAGTYKDAGKPGAMKLGEIMSLDDVPFYYMTDRYGDQVALPCTERNLTADAAQASVARGIMPVLSMKGRNEIRLGSFRSVNGAELAGAWAESVPPASSSSGRVGMDLEVDIATKTPETEGASPAPASDSPAEPAAATGTDPAADDDMSLDDLLAGFGDDASSDGDTDDEMDPELAELLKGL